MMLFMMMFIMIMYIINDYMLIKYIQKNSYIFEALNQLTLYKNEDLTSLSMLYTSSNFLINILMINYLLMTFIAVVKITKSNSGPLRQKLQWMNLYELTTHYLKLWMEL